MRLLIYREVIKMPTKANRKCVCWLLELHSVKMIIIYEGAMGAKTLLITVLFACIF
jgi:hypothetical protein